MPAFSIFTTTWSSPFETHGCLAWGAIDLGANANGDMMHFDCRATGIGWKLSLPNQRTAAASHPCVSSRAAAEQLEEMQELETPPTVGSPATAEPFADGRLWSFASRTLPLRVGVFCPKAVNTRKPIDVLVYAHGHLDPCPPVPKIVPDDLFKKAPFALAKIVSASKRAIVLVVPVLDWGNLRTNGLAHEACNRPNMHRLGVPANLNGVLAEVLAEVGRVHGTRVPAIANLILSGHSRAFDFLNPLALAHADPDMAKGALAVLSEVWAFDTTYVCYMAEWQRWLQSKPGLQMTVVYRKGSKTTACGEKFEKAAPKSGGRLRVIRASERHCDVPIVRLPALLNPSAAPSVGKESKEVEEWVDEPGESEAELGDGELGQSAATLHEDNGEELSELEDADEAEQALAWELNAINDELEELETETVDAESDDREADVEGEWDEGESAAVGGARPDLTCKDDRCTSAYIMWMQKSLNTVLRTSLPVSGRLDRATQIAIKKFKKTKRVKTKEAYAGAAIERALVAAGAQAPPPLAKVPCGVSQASELVPLLEKYRGDIPLALLLGWIQVESGRDLGSLTSICERGYFQLHPDESAMLGLDHDLVGTNADYSVSGGIALVKHYRKTIDTLSKTHGIARGSDLYWRLVKLCHWIPSGPRKILTRMQEQGTPVGDWESIRTFARAHREVLKDAIKRDPVVGLESVDRTFTHVEAWRQKLKKS